MEDKIKSPSRGAGADSSRLVISTLVTTNLLIFIPVLGSLGLGAALGWWLGVVNTGMLVGVGVGIVIAAILVARQIHAIRKGRK
ncbi:MAG: hypothetical protein LBC95_01605 [Candidatus Nomurabacteria bacterium]|nr:hypothetical protein [Candidatus Nomurabacteria bacterium]